MRVIIKRDSATATPVECGEGEAARKQIANLCEIHGRDNVIVEGVVPPALPPGKPEKPPKPPKPPKAKATKGKK